MPLYLVKTVNQLINDYKRQLVLLDLLAELKDYKDPRHIDAKVELRTLDRDFKELTDRAKEEYGDEVQSLLLYAAEYIFILEADEK